MSSGPPAHWGAWADGTGSLVKKRYGHAQCDPRVGGLWTVTFGPSRDELYRHDHILGVIDRPSRLVLDSTFLPGNLIVLSQRWHRPVSSGRYGREALVKGM